MRVSTENEELYMEKIMKEPLYSALNDGTIQTRPEEDGFA